MIKIIKPGKTVFNAKCNRCACEFTYEFEDLWGSFGSKYVKCPECGDEYFHPSQDDKKKIDLQSPFGTFGDCISNDMYNCLIGNHVWKYAGTKTNGTTYKCQRCGIERFEQLSKNIEVTTALLNVEELK